MLFCGAVMVGGALLESCQKNNPAPAVTPVNFTLNLADPANAALKNVGGSVINNTVVVIRTSASAYTALSNVCTHAGCTVSFYSNQNQLVCPCHGGTFDINGNVTSGPPPSALTKYTCTLSGNSLTVTS